VVAISVRTNVRTNEQMNERSGQTARKHNALADTVEWWRHENILLV